MLVWDNWLLLHGRNSFSDRNRHLRRIQIAKAHD
ncbi:TauD/TfdA family dioxygenase [Kibdelosporangium aridum subsp. largum]